MYNLFFIVFIFFLSFISLMAVGVFLGRKPIKGSCGGLGKIMGEECSFCNHKDKCTKSKFKLQKL